MESIIPYILSFGTKIIVIFIGISRLVELTVRVIFAPFAVADVYQKGSNSGGMRYLRKIFALILQFAAIVGIYIACASIISSLNISSNGADMYETLTGSTEESVYTYAGYSSTVTITSISKNACITFLDSLFGGSGNYWLCMGVLLARIGLAIKSQQIANDIAGV